MKREDIDKVRVRKNEAAAVARTRDRAIWNIRHASGKAERVADLQYDSRFVLARLWVTRTATPDGEVTQVGKAGFYWKHREGDVPQFVAWDSEALRKLAAGERVLA